MYALPITANREALRCGVLPDILWSLPDTDKNILMRHTDEDKVTRTEWRGQTDEDRRSRTDCRGRTVEDGPTRTDRRGRTDEDGPTRTDRRGRTDEDGPTRTGFVGENQNKKLIFLEYVFRHWLERADWTQGRIHDKFPFLLFHFSLDLVLFLQW